MEDEQTQLMRAGVQSRIARLASAAGSGVRRWSPPVLLGALCAGAFGPLLLAISTGGAVATAAVGLAGSVGGDILSDVLTKVVDRLRDSGRELVQEEIEDELQQRIEELLRADDKQAAQLREEIARVLRQVDGVSAAVDAMGAAVQDAIRTGNEQLQERMAEGLERLAREFAEDVVGEVRGAAAEIQETLRRQDAERRHERDHGRQLGLRLRQMDATLALIEYRTRTNASSERSEGGTRWTGCPYRGLSPFDEDQAEVFYGRERTTAELVGTLGERLSGLGLVVVTGASGVGKSSLLRAGLLPALARGSLSPSSAEWPRLVMTPTRSPLEELGTRLAALAGLDPIDVCDSLTKRPEQAHLLVRQAVLADAERRLLPASGAQSRLVLVVDQFEEIFTPDQDRDQEAGHAAEVRRSAFITALHAAAGTASRPAQEPAALVVIAVRGDFGDRCSAYPQLAEALSEGMFVVPAMGASDLRQAITGPADAAGLQIEPGLVDSILAELRSPQAPGGYEAGALPWLSQAMLVTWNHRENGRLTARGYGLSGGVRNAIHKSAENTYSSLSPERQMVARQVLLKMTVVASDVALTSRRMSHNDLRGGLTEEERAEIDEVLETFAAQRLIMVGDDNVEIAHEELLRAWPRLREWLEPDLAGHMLYSQLLDDAATWDRHQRDPSFLYRGAQMTAVEQAAARWKADPARYSLPDVPRSFLDAATRAAKRRIRQRRAVLATLAGLLLAVIIAAASAINAAGDASRQRTLAVSRQLAAQSEAIEETDPAASARLAAAAWRTAPTNEAKYRILTTLRNPYRATLTGHTGWVTGVAFSPDGRILATASEDQTVQLWEFATRQPLGFPLAGHTGSVTGVAFSPDGRTLATTSTDNTVRLWDVTARRPLGAPLTGHTDSVTGVVFHPDGRTLATTSEDRTVRLWDVATRRPLGAPLARHTGSAGVAFSPDGRTLATTSEDRTVRLWDVTTRRPLGRPLTGHTGSVTGVAFSPDGRTLATTGKDRTVRLWDVTARRPLGAPLTGHTSWVIGVAFNPDGRTMATTSSDNTVRLWDVTARRPLGAPLTGHTSWVIGVAFHPDGRTMATTSTVSVRLWDLTRRRPLGSPLTGHTGSVYGVAFSPDGRTLATTSFDRTVRLWDVTTRRPLGSPLTGHTGWVNGVAFSPDGRTLATTSEDRTVRLWDVTTRRPLGSPLTGHTGWVNGVTFSPDGRTLATGSTDRTVRLWDVTTRRPLGSPLTGHTSWVTGMAFSPDGRTLATGSEDRTVRLWETATWRPLGAPLTEHTSRVNRVAFSPNGRTLATTSEDRTVRLWDVTTRQPLGLPLTGHTDWVNGVAFSPDGRTLATTSTDSTVRLWDVTTRRPLGSPLTGHNSSAFGVAFSPDGRTLASTGRDRTVQLWDVSVPPDLLASVCSIAGRSITAAEWAFYAPDEEFKRACL